MRNYLLAAQQLFASHEIMHPMVSVNIALSYINFAVMSILTVHVNNMDSVSKELNSGWRQASSSRAPLPTQHEPTDDLLKKNLKSYYQGSMPTT